MKFFSPEVALYLYKSIIRSCMEYCCTLFAGASSCHMELLEKLQKWIVHNFSVTIPRCYEDLYANSFFPGTTARIICL